MYLAAGEAEPNSMSIAIGIHRSLCSNVGAQVARVRFKEPLSARLGSQGRKQQLQLGSQTHLDVCGSSAAWMSSSLSIMSSQTGQTRPLSASRRRLGALSRPSLAPLSENQSPGGGPSALLLLLALVLG